MNCFHATAPAMFSLAGTGTRPVPTNYIDADRKLVALLA